MSDALQSACDAAVAQVKKEWQAQCYRQSVVDCPAKFEETFKGKMVVRSSVYGLKGGDCGITALNMGISPVRAYKDCTGDRPAHMKGSLPVINHHWNTRNYGHKAEYEVAVIKRYLRRIKYTSFDTFKTSEMIKELFRTLYEKLWGTSYPHYATRDAALIDLRCHSRLHYYMNGTARFKSNVEQVKLAKHMWKIEQKLRRLEP